MIITFCFVINFELLSSIPKVASIKKWKWETFALYLLSYSMYLLPYRKPSSEQGFIQCLGRIMFHET